MRSQRLVRDVADRSGAALGISGRIAPAPAFVNARALSKKSRDAANGMPVKRSGRNVAELKIDVGGLPVVLTFRIDDVSPMKSSDFGKGETDIPSLLSNALEKVVGHLRGSGARFAAAVPSDPSTSIEMDPEMEYAALPAGAPTVLRVGALELNLLDRTAKRGDRSIDLRPREFQLLRYMMERHDKLLTRAKLFQEVWNYKFVPQTNLVDVHMGRLRRKVDGPNEPALIRSIRGEGFVLSGSPLSQN